MSGRWAPRPVEGFADGTVLYDGVCVICSRFFRFVAARDWAYDRLARNRYALFGRTETCMVPDAALRRHVATEP